ncbi:carbon-nitrogen hydrolase family protein [Glutamicibacter sp. MNS18]|uniref:carbon-nitrogen hydrolase family protein n=1 Tax=Glutamicibacter sp. MNS18 TaxID=2989817 RepID=UPI0022362BB6|nr:carbon-nitrogen hydrolase family protein [Glutamicibacter sp. MNS18]MCW4466357.1 carbon-nitrogen hydrolase family protein [Glutamicibacter sp. MNS18]
MKIAMAQVLSTENPQRNLEIIRELSGQAAEQGGRIVVFPEAMQIAMGNDLLEAAEPVDGHWANSVRQIARESDITILAGMFTPGVGRRLRNTLLVTGPTVDTSYDKIHLYDAFGFAESDSVTPGERPVQFSIDGVKFGVATCYDLRFPRLFTHHANHGAVVNLVCASWGAGPGKAEQWRTLAVARALDTTTFVIAVDQADPESTGVSVTGTAPLGVGFSIAVDPLGRILHQAGIGEELQVVELDLSLIDEAREKLPVLANARDL